MKLLKLVLVFMLVGLGASFASLNPGVVRLDFYVATREVPVALAMTVALGFGAMLGALAASGRLMRLRREISELRRASRLTAAEVANLRALPIKGH